MLGRVDRSETGICEGQGGRDTCLGGRLLLWFWRGRLVGWRRL